MANSPKAQPSSARRFAIVSGRPPKSQAIRSEEHFARLPSLIWQTRRRLGMNLMAMGRAVGVRPQRIIDAELGERFLKRDRLDRLAELMGIDLTAIVLLQVAAVVDRKFRRGAPTPEALHRRVVQQIENAADLRPRGSK